MSTHAGGARRASAAAPSEGVRAKERMVGHDVEYSGSKGIVRVTEVGEEGYYVQHYADRDSLRYGVGTSEPAHTTSAVNAELRRIGYSNTFDYAVLAHAGPSVSKSGGKASRPQSAISRGADWQNARPGSGLGRYVVSVGDRDLAIERQSGGQVRITDTNRMTGKTAERVLPSDAQARTYLRTVGAKGAFADAIVKMAAHDVERYVERAPTKAEAAQIARTDARRAALDAKYGMFSDERAKAAMQGVFSRVPGMEDAIYSHLIGGSYLSAKSVADVLSEDHPIAAKVRAAIGPALKDMRAISEWSLLHSPNVTRAGTVRLWHGTNGQSSPDTWRSRLTSAGALQATPFTTNWRVAEHFAENGPHGRLVVSAQVPASAVMTWYGVSQSASWGEEEEYTVGGGKGAISDFEFIRVPKSARR